MQRLFVMFPTGAPGLALVLIRTALGAGLIVTAIGSTGQGLNWFAMAVAAGLAAGVATPMLSVLCVAIDVYRMTTGTPTAPCALHVVNAVALALLGPGAYSLDSHFFGRRRVV
jgi:hypothetical protein